ncbi:four helix bundle protein [Roseimaritima sediminicola]|uniref:four helix bundle protein n=1 Tax=Roseimaritima sediminicola TaxID=2662066 RepID=UPI00129843FE|nr:four helix bundle protein [Roseimaritima sediminicola]
MNSFEELECYRAARRIRCEASKFCKTLPGNERFRLVDQMLRASRSVTANIAEGYGRHHHRENLQFLRQARGSLYETIEHYHTALDESYITTEQHSIRRAEVEEAIRILNGFIRYVNGCAERQHRR